VYNLKNFI